EGRVVRLLGDLEALGRMARVLIAVDEPLAGSGDANGLPLLLGSYARVEIEAGELEDVIAIPRTALRDGDRLWAVDASNTLQIHETELRWVDGETLLVNNTLAAGEKLIVSGLRAALPGMEVDPQPAPDSTPLPE
ncbi:MAG: efflux RND transporter periplasmic adaptor subunit, partial [Verrucomicrobiales bacterium]